MLVRDRSMSKRVDGASRRRAAAGRSVGEEPRSGFIPMLMALYLTPALLVVLLVGGIGLVVLAMARAISWLVQGPEAWHRRPVGPQSRVS